MSKKRPDAVRWNGPEGCDAVLRGPTVWLRRGQPAHVMRARPILRRARERRVAHRRRDRRRFESVDSRVRHRRGRRGRRAAALRRRSPADAKGLAGLREGRDAGKRAVAARQIKAEELAARRALGRASTPPTPAAAVARAAGGGGGGGLPGLGGDRREAAAEPRRRTRAFAARPSLVWPPLGAPGRTCSRRSATRPRRAARSSAPPKAGRADTLTGSTRCANVLSNHASPTEGLWRAGCSVEAPRRDQRHTRGPPTPARASGPSGGSSRIGCRPIYARVTVIFTGPRNP